MSANAETIVVARAPGDGPTVTPTRRRPSSPSPHRRRPPSTRSRREGPPATPPRPPAATPRARTGVFVAFLLLILTIGLLAMLWINTTLAQGAFVLSDLQQQRATLIEAEQQLREDLARAEAPARVEQAARDLGMVPQDVPVFLRLDDGAILGNPIPQPAPIVEEPVVEEPVVEEPVVEESVVEEPVVEEETP